LAKTLLINRKLRCSSLKDERGANLVGWASRARVVEALGVEGETEGGLDAGTGDADT